jgi:very-short-patch-repair endonuclease
MTRSERLLWSRIRERQLGGHYFIRQHPVGRYIADFCCRKARLVIEVDGGQHDSDRAADQDRTNALEADGYRVLRFWNNEVLENIDGVLIRISEALNETGAELPERPLP